MPYHISDDGKVRRCSTTPDQCEFMGGQFDSFDAAYESETFKETVAELSSLPKLRKASKEEEAKDINNDEKLLSGLTEDYSDFNSKYEAKISEIEDEDENAAESKPTSNPTKVNSEKLKEAQTNKVKAEKAAKDKKDHQYGAEHAESGVAEGLIASTLLRHSTNSGDAFDKGYISKLEELAKLEKSDDKKRRYILADFKAEAKAAKVTRPINHEPTEEDKNEAYHSVMTELGNNSYGSWERLMGKRSVTKNSVAEYHDKLHEMVKDNPISPHKANIQHEAERLASQRQFARDFESGNESPSNEAFFEKVWASEVQGQGLTHEEVAKRDHEDAKELMAKYERGEVTPGKIVGGGYKNPKKVAKEYLERRIAETGKIVETRGRSDLNILVRSGLAKH